MLGFFFLNLLANSSVLFYTTTARVHRPQTHTHTHTWTVVYIMQLGWRWESGLTYNTKVSNPSRIGCRSDYWRGLVEPNGEEKNKITWPAETWEIHVASVLHLTLYTLVIWRFPVLLTGTPNVSSAVEFRSRQSSWLKNHPSCSSSLKFGSVRKAAVQQSVCRRRG